MKHLTLIRHAKSSHTLSGIADIDRPLNSRGEAATRIMAERLRESRFTFDVAFCSPAKRAQQTAAGIFTNEWTSRVRTETALYTFDVEYMVRFIELIESKLDHVVLVGHNPAITLLVNELCRSNIDNVPTCGIAQMELRIDNWFDIAAGTGLLLNYDYPKNNRDWS